MVFSFTIVVLFVIFISASFANIIKVPQDKSTIQAGIDSAITGDTVLVAENTYYENISFKGKAITVASRFIMDGDTSHISKTIIDGSHPSHPDSGSVVYFVSGEDTNSVLCGFTITGGTGTKSYWEDDLHWHGGGVLCVSGGKIMNNIVTNNVIDVDVFYAHGGGISAGWWFTEYVIIHGNTISSNSVKNKWAGGGGIGFYCNGKITDNIVDGNIVTATENWGYAGGIECFALDPMVISVDIDNNQIENNQVHAIKSGESRSHGAGIRYSRSNGMISNNIIKNNSGQSNHHAFGGGIFIDSSPNTLIANNIIKNNSGQSNHQAFGGGIFIGTSPTTVIANNLISSNRVETGAGGTHSRGGGIAYYAKAKDVFGYASIHNNIIINNEARGGGTNSFGGGVSISGDGNDYAVLFNNTIVNNSADSSGGGIRINMTTSQMCNSIVWGNQASNFAQIFSENPIGEFIVRNCDVQGGWDCVENIDSDPLFADTLYHLSEYSPCIGAGTKGFELYGHWYSCPTIDFYGHLRPNPIDEYVDIGALESPFPKTLIGIRNWTEQLPQAFVLDQNYPNPFNERTVINYELPITNYIEVSIYNVIGQKVTTLVSGKQKAGVYTVEWDASKMASGVYYYLMQVANTSVRGGKFQDIKKMVVIR